MQNEWTRAISGLQRRGGDERGASAWSEPKRAAARPKQRIEKQRRIRVKYQHFCLEVTSAINASAP